MSINKNLIIATALLLISLGLSLYMANYYRDKYKSEKEEKESVMLAYSKTLSEVEMYKNDNGKIVIRNEALELQVSNLNKMIDEGFLKQVRELNGVRKNLKNLEFVYKLTADVIDSMKVKLKDTTRTYINEKHDTLYFRVAELDYKDEWAEIKETQLTPFESKVDYKFHVPLTGAMFWDRKWFLGKKKYWGEATSDNPHAVIPELVNIKVSRMRKKRAVQ